MNITTKKSPPPPHFLIKNVLFGCLFLLAFLAVPVQSQSTPVPTAPPRLTNPTVMAPCGLPASYAEFNSSSTITTFNMTADCVFNSWAVQIGSAFLQFSSGIFTINGNGHSIIGPAGTGYTLYVDGANTVLNLNDVTIREGGGTNLAVILVSAGRLNARNVIFRDNDVTSLLFLSADGQAYLENVQFLNNRGIGFLPTLIYPSTSGDLVSITNSIFQDNADFDYLIDFAGAVQLQGCITRADGLGNNQQAGGALTDSTTGECPPGLRFPKKKKKEKVPTATPTPRLLAVTCPALSQFGIAVHATYGLASGVQCQRLDGGGIGIQSIVEAGFIDAVDIWGYVEQGVEVCFPQIGRVVFLDARTMPRAIVPLESTVVNGQTCVSINSPGSLVLLPN